MRCARGQGTVEYLGVVLLVAVVGGAFTTIAVGGPGREIAAGVSRAVVRGLCIVTGGDCDRDLAPCDVGSATMRREVSVTVLVVKGGHRKVLVRARRSDGKVAVTLSNAPEIGLETGTGFRARLKRGRREIALGGELTAAASVALGRGRTWLVADEPAADALVSALESGASVRPADEETEDVRAEVGGRAATGPGPAARLSGDVSAHLGGMRSTDRATGNRTYLFDLGVAGAGGAFVLDGRGSASASGADSDRFAVTVARDGRWLNLMRVRVGELSGAVSLPPDLASVARRLDVPAGGRWHRRWVAETHLDLSDAANLAAAQAFVASLRSRGPLAAARTGNALLQRMNQHGVIHARTYAVDTQANGFEGHAGGGLKLGGRYDNTQEQTRLIAAETRGIDGRWRSRDDCLQEVRR